MIKENTMTDFKQFDLNTINTRLQHVTFDMSSRVSRKQFNIDKADVSHFWERLNICQIYMFDLIFHLKPTLFAVVTLA